MDKKYLEELLHEKLSLIPTGNTQKAVNIILDEIKQLEEAKKQVFVYLEKRYLTSSTMGEIETLYNSILENK